MTREELVRIREEAIRTGMSIRILGDEEYRSGEEVENVAEYPVPEDVLIYKKHIAVLIHIEGEKTQRHKLKFHKIYAFELFDGDNY